MKRLFESGVWHVESTQRGKKGFPTVITVFGIPTDAGSGRVMLAVEDGTVIEAGRCYSDTARKSRLGCYVMLATSDGRVFTYFRLGEVYVKPGDTVTADQPIGKASWAEYARIEVRRRNRRLDICAALGLKERE